MQSNSYLKLKKYFENLVKNHVHIHTFCGYFNRELNVKLARYEGIPHPYLALFDYKLGLDGSKQNTVALRSFAFAIMLNGVDSDNFESQYQAIDTAERLALSVLARVQLDNNNKSHFLFNTFLKDKVRILPVELSNESFGVEVFLGLKNPQNLTVDPDDWLDLSSVC